jgi:23S rRNA (uracil1939-C5)-methyltransferase
VRTTELTIERIVAGGDGIGRANDVVVFVPRTAPGDRARVSLDLRKRFARGTLDELLVPSPDRVDPPCAHYRVDRCGGCQLQHLRYEAQLEAKRGIVRDALTRIGKRRVGLPDIEPSDPRWRYRKKLTLAMRRRSDGGWTAGLHPYDDPVGLFQLADCPITDERVVNVWRQVMDASRYYPPADELRASVRLLGNSEEGNGGASIVMEGGNAWPDRLAFFEAVPAASALWWKPVHRSRNLVAERGANLGRWPASGSFVQVNASVAASLGAYVLERARAYEPASVVDAYAGSGDMAIALAQGGARVVAIEWDRDAVAQCASKLPEGSRAVAAKVEDVLHRALPADLVVINPPRTGVHERVSETLQSLVGPPRCVIYVSCDPATLGRDLMRMPRYRIASLRSFDMFPQTAHVETVCELVPDADGASE